MPSEQPADAAPSEDELARMMIERIARQVDLETGRVPLATEDEKPPSADDPAAIAPGEDPAEPVAEEAEEPPEEESPATSSSGSRARWTKSRTARLRPPPS